MEPRYVILISALSGIIIQLGLIVRTKVREKEKSKRITEFKDMDDSKINAIGNYEEKSKDRFIK